ncbi:monovalent cation/H+ antiporter complex subunit F [Brachybacterium hainanense]|uniref:Monovalent cation/H+ antiporter complex subunit F n=1 Tax=Brachybacterium hainanense TaxID=1541174 RepID=A0ABV6RAH5_9MICO
MSTIEIVLTVYGILLAVAALPTVYRIVVGPTILDRAVATDMLVVLVVLGMALYSAGTASTWAVPSMLVLTAFAFIGTVGVARFVAREDPRRVRPGPRGSDGIEHVGTETGHHDAIHVDAPELLAGWAEEDAVRAHRPDAEDEQGLPDNTPSVRTDAAEVPRNPHTPGPGTAAEEGRG